MWRELGLTFWVYCNWFGEKTNKNHSEVNVSNRLILHRRLFGEQANVALRHIFPSEKSVAFYGCSFVSRAAWWWGLPPEGAGHRALFPGARLTPRRPSPDRSERFLSIIILRKIDFCGLLDRAAALRQEKRNKRRKTVGSGRDFRATILRLQCAYSVWKDKRVSSSDGLSQKSCDKTTEMVE